MSEYNNCEAYHGDVYGFLTAIALEGSALARQEALVTPTENADPAMKPQEHEHQLIGVKVDHVN